MNRIACAMLLAIGAPVAHAKVANISYADLAKWSDAIAVGQVRRIDLVNGRRRATIEILSR